MADTKVSVVRLERRARGLEAALETEKEKATRQAEESAVEVACLEGRSRTLQSQLEAAMARTSAAEEKVTTRVVLMEAAREAAEAVPRSKALAEFVEEVREAVVDSFLKGFAGCKTGGPGLSHPEPGVNRPGLSRQRRHGGGVPDWRGWYGDRRGGSRLVHLAGRELR